MDEESKEEPKRRFPWIRWALVGTVLGAGAYLVLRDRQRRAQGLERRSPRRLLIRYLSSKNIPGAHFVADYLTDHRIQAYGGLSLLGFFGYKYSAHLHQIWRRFRLKAGSEDVLTEYPHNEEEEEQEELNRAVKTQRDQLDASMADTRIRDSGREFLMSLSHVIQGIDEKSIVSLYEKMQPVALEKGQVLFRQGDLCEDGMYVIISGSLGVYREEESIEQTGESTYALAAATPEDGGEPEGSGGGGDVGWSLDEPGSPGPGEAALSSEAMQSAGVKRQVKEVYLCSFGSTQTIGENGLLGGPKETRAVTCRALEDCQLLRLNRALFAWLQAQHPHALMSFILNTTARQWRVAYFAVVDFLGLPDAWSKAFDSDIPAFSTGEVKSLAPASTGVLHLDPGAVLYSVGDAADCVYVLSSGEASSTISEKTGPNSRRHLSPGCVVGGVATFANVPHKEKVVCRTQCEFMCFPRRVFEALSMGPTMAGGLAQITAILKLALVVASYTTRLLRLFLSSGLQRGWYRAGDQLFKEGDPSDSLHLVISGRLRTYRSGKIKRRKSGSHEGHQLIGTGTQYEDSDSEDEEDGSDMEQPATASVPPAHAANVFRLEIGRGESVGELAAISGQQTRDVSAVCTRDCEVVTISSSAFQRMLNAYPSILRRFAEVLAKRYEELSTLVQSDTMSGVSHAEAMAGSTLSGGIVGTNIVTIAVLPAGGSPPSSTRLSSFASSLTQALQIEGPAIHVNRNLIDQALGSGTCERMSDLFQRARVAAWLDALEESHRFVVFEGDGGPTPWTACCSQQADLVFLVGRAHTSPELSDVEERLVFRRPDGLHTHSWLAPATRTFSRKELVLLHTKIGKQPKGTRAWLRVRSVALHHHIRTYELGDVGRLARHICGRSVGVVLGGGGARGLAHLGVLRALEEQGVPVDFIGGTSQGAFMAGCYAMTLNVEKAKKLSTALAQLIGNPLQLLASLTLPLVSYFSGSRFNDILLRVFEDTQIEDLWLRYFAVTTNISRSRMQVHQTGPLWRYARASMTVLGLLPPVYDRGRLLVDGGYVNNLPVDVMKAIFPSVAVVVAVDVENKDMSDVMNVYNYGDSLSGWWLLGKYILSLLRLSEPVKIPSLSNVMLHLSYITHSMTIRDMLRRGKKDASIIYVTPDVQHFKLLEYGKMDEIVRLGFEAANKKLEVARRRRERRNMSTLTGEPSSAAIAKVLQSSKARGGRALSASHLEEFADQMETASASDSKDAEEERQLDTAAPLRLPPRPPRRGRLVDRSGSRTDSSLGGLGGNRWSRQHLSMLDLYSPSHTPGFR